MDWCEESGKHCFTVGKCWWGGGAGAGGGGVSKLMRHGKEGDRW